ncbi:c-type cytochrome [Pseudoroseicyclus aestuarii]|uniref:Cytochrome c556 n=1 Tax=Pseudoroseicyclus aestuarii TaxID=1795041 RepID=A0A318SSU9_9RHOB|nr:cytochrome c [Pseudoroseicyclus aestuarii]PYE81187.1 cytochrome c556 [Pseudoroseicyclus aestuarii]
MFATPLRRTGLAAGLVLSCLAALPAAAQDEPLTPEAAHEAREEHMKMLGQNLGVIGRMAQGEVDYDAEAAQEAADALVEISGMDMEAWLVEGSDSESLEDSRALPIIWDETEDYLAQWEDLHQAALAMQEVAGTDLAALQGAMGPLGQSCGGCHRTYRASE